MSGRDDLELDALEQQWAADLGADAGPRPGDTERIGRLVDRALDAAPAAASPGLSTGAWVGAGVVVAIVLAVVAWPSPTPEFPPPTTATVAKTRPEPEPEPAPAPAPVAVPAPAPTETVAELPAPPEAAARFELGPAELFARANAARRAHEYDEAIGLYTRLQRAHEGSREAEVSRVALGRLLLDEKDQPQRALRLFGAYLRATPDGELAEEATAGRALALRRLGRDDDERAAWRTLVERFPGSAWGEKARARLQELDAASGP
jgi:TolA-binding protein